MAGIGGDGGSDYASAEGRHQYQRRGSSNSKGGAGGGCYGAAEFHASQPHVTVTHQCARVTPGRRIRAVTARGERLFACPEPLN